MGIPERWKGHKPLLQGISGSLEKLTPIFEREGVLLAYLFGSLAKAEEAGEREAHDIDPALLLNSSPPQIRTSADGKLRDRPAPPSAPPALPCPRPQGMGTRAEREGGEDDDPLLRPSIPEDSKLKITAPRPPANPTSTAKRSTKAPL